jgi:ABC exporter DevB family membrane fusion protein
VSVWPLLLVAAAGFSAGLVAFQYKDQFLSLLPGTAKPPAEEKAASPDRIVALGRLRPAGGIRTVVGPPGDQIAKLFVKEGDTVKASDPLVELASRADRKAELDLLDKQIADAREQVQIALTKAEGDRAVAKAKLDEMTDVAPHEIEAQKAKLAVLALQQAHADNRLRGMRELQKVSPHTVSDQEVEGQRLLAEQAKAELEAARVLLKKAEAARANGEQVAKLQFKAAEDNLARVQKENPVESLQMKRDLAQLQYDRTELRAPVAGTVVKLTGQVGDATAPQQPILQLAAAGDMVAVAEVHERDVGRLRQWVKDYGSAKAVISSRALPIGANGKPMELAGTVTAGQIGTLIARNTAFDVDPTADADRRVFEVVVTIDPKDRDLAARYLNLQVQVTFPPPAAGPPGATAPAAGP